MANRVTDKITPLTDSIYICRSGSAADTQNLSRYVQVGGVLGGLRKADVACCAQAAGSGHALALSALHLHALRNYVCHLPPDQPRPANPALQPARACSVAAPQWFLEQHGMELGEEPAVATAAKLAQEMAYQNKNFLQVGVGKRAKGGPS